jgi:glucan biosynthesis protein C
MGAQVRGERVWFLDVPQPVILAIAFFVVGWDVGLWTKDVVLLPAAFVTSASLAWTLSVVSGLSTLFGVKRQGRLSNPAVRRSSTE